VAPARVAPAHSLNLRNPAGSQRDFARLQSGLVCVEDDCEFFGQALREGHHLLKDLGPLEMIGSIRKYLEGDNSLAASITNVLGDLDVALFTRGQLLFEDLPQSFLDTWLRDPSAFSGDNTQSVSDLRTLLYGQDARFPIPFVCFDASEPKPTPQRRQLAIERQTQSAAFIQYRLQQEKMEKEGRASESNAKKRVWMNWVHDMAQKISLLHEDPSKQGKSRNKMGVQLVVASALPPDLISVITCQTLLNLVYTWRSGQRERVSLDHEHVNVLQSMSVPWVTAIVSVGEAVERECSFREFEDHAREASGKTANPTSRPMLAQLLRFKSRDKGWDKQLQTVPVGDTLLDMLMSSAILEVDKNGLLPHDEVSDAEMEALSSGLGAGGRMVRISAFKHYQLRDGKKTFGHVMLRPAAQKVMDFSKEDLMSAIALKHQPMVVEPRPWRPSGEHAEGAYLLHRVPFLRTANQTMTHLRTYSPGRVARIIDTLGLTPWRINGQVLKCMEEVVKRDLAIADVPPKDDPVIPEALTAEQFDELSAEERKELTLARHNAMKRHNELKSERPTFQLKLQVAQDFVRVPRLYFPHNVDFRGRAYPIPPHLNHVSDDISRGLLMFAEPKPLGNDGLFWLKVSMANLLGKDKLPFDERVAYVDSCKEWIMQVAKDPLAEEWRDKWANASDGPWQVLARCFELADIWATGDERGYASQLPVQLDGSCNGLQHYAALGRDEWGGKAVNLSPSDRPQDVYSVVLGIVKKKVQSHRLSGTDEQCALAEQLENLGLLQRKVVKRTVMTICYGVTSIGAIAQVQREIQDLVGEHVDPREISKMAKYLSRLILESIDEVFERAMVIKAWFDKVSSILNKLECPVSWVSPIGLACVQPYRKVETVHVKTTRQKLTLAVGDGPLMNKAKQRMGFPPNFIHSLDASHMMLTAEACAQHGICFAGVHDSFWTHACDAPVLNRIIRDAFIDLHSRPILQELYEDIRLQVGTVASIPPLPSQGNLDLSQVRESLYIFS